MASKRGRGARGSASLPEIFAVWLLFFAAAAAIFVTYWRVPPRETYHVSLSGFDGGASRLVVFLCFPTALAAIAILGLVYKRLRGRWALPVVLLALLLCASVTWPGVVDEADLDVKWSNAFASVGVLLVFFLSFLARERGPVPAPSRAGDKARLAVGAVAVFAAAPYIAAELGFFLDGVPVLGWIFVTSKIAPENGGDLAPAVHHGHHHGMDGLLLTLTALVLSRSLGSAGSRLRYPLGAYLALLLAYGLANEIQDLWQEQLVKRDVVNWAIPPVLHPTLTPEFGVVVGAGVLLLVLLTHASKDAPDDH
jgi:hypothetical protein